MSETKDPVDLYDKEKLADEKYFDLWYQKNIEWIRVNQYNEKYDNLLSQISYALAEK